MVGPHIVEGGAYPVEQTEKTMKKGKGRPRGARKLLKRKTTKMISSKEFKRVINYFNQGSYQAKAGLKTRSGRTIKPTSVLYNTINATTRTSEKINVGNVPENPEGNVPKTTRTSEKINVGNVPENPEGNVPETTFKEPRDPPKSEVEPKEVAEEAAKSRDRDACSPNLSERVQPISESSGAKKPGETSTNDPIAEENVTEATIKEQSVVQPISRETKTSRNDPIDKENIAESINKQPRVRLISRSSGAKQPRETNTNASIVEEIVTEAIVKKQPRVLLTSKSSGAKQLRETSPIVAEVTFKEPLQSRKESNSSQRTTRPLRGTTNSELPTFKLLEERRPENQRALRRNEISLDGGKSAVLIKKGGGIISSVGAIGEETEGTSTQEKQKGALVDLKDENVCVKKTKVQIKLNKSCSPKRKQHELVVRDGDKVKHFRIRRLHEGSYYIDRKVVFCSLHELVGHYSKYADVLCVKLCKPNDQIDPQPEASLRRTPDHWETDRSSLKFISMLGQGLFGVVWSGLWHNTTPVAIKTLKIGFMHREDFLAEAQIMKQLRHPNVVRLYAVCSMEEPIYIVMELMKNGSLADYLRRRGKALELPDLIEMAAQIAAGMAYLESQNYVHRDLATRNVLVNENNILKIADFGFACLIKEAECKVRSRFPIKRTAPEVTNSSKYSIKSDVWSFGNILIELVTYGRKPNPGRLNEEVLNGYHLCPPPNCPETLYKIMLNCWHGDAAQRPTFQTLQWLMENFTVDSERY